MQLRPLHSAFGAEILDFDLEATSPDDIAALREALDAHQLLLLRPGRRIAPERHAEIGGWFGPLMGHDGARWSTLDNQDAAGSMRLPFHSDFSYTQTPIKLISLQALDMPPGGSATAYASGIHAWRTLSADRQAELGALTLRHRHTSRIGGTWPEFVAEHPLRLTHPRTGEPVLYLTEYHAERILELEPAESDRLIAELKAHLYAPQNIYTHAWRPNDLLIWDNLAVQHARPAVAEQAAGRRVLQRVAVNDASLEEMVDRAWRRMGGRPEAQAGA